MSTSTLTYGTPDPETGFTPDVERLGVVYKYGRNVHRVRLLTEAARNAAPADLVYLVDRTGFGGVVEHFDAENFRTAVPDPQGHTLVVIYTD